MSEESTAIAEQLRLLQEGIQALTRNLDAFEATRSDMRSTGLGSGVLGRFLIEGEDASDIAHGDTEWVLLSSVVVSASVSQSVCAWQRVSFTTIFFHDYRNH